MRWISCIMRDVDMFQGRNLRFGPISNERPRTRSQSIFYIVKFIVVDTKSLSIERYTTIAGFAISYHHSSTRMCSLVESDSYIGDLTNGAEICAIRTRLVLRRKDDRVPHLTKA